MMKPCGNIKCSVSVTVDGIPAFGWGEMDKNGYWQFPCEICARNWEERYPGRKAWPKMEDEDFNTKEYKVIHSQVKKHIFEAEINTKEHNKYFIAVEAILSSIISWNEIRMAWYKLNDEQKEEIKSVCLDIIREVL